MISIKRIVAFILTLFITLSTCTTAFAINNDYVGENFVWHNSNVSTTNLNYPKGYYQHFYEENDNSFYFHISYSLNDFSNDDKIEISIYINNSINSYSILFNKNNISCSGGDLNKSFKISYYFSPIVGNGQDIYFGISFLNKNDIKLNNNISVSLKVNNNIYKIANNIDLKFNSEEKTTNNVTTKNNNNNNTNATQKESQNGNKPTKFHYNSSENNNEFNTGHIEQKGQNNNSQKFNYNPQNNIENNNDIETHSNNLFDKNGEIVIPNKENKVTFSPISIILITVSAILCTLGICLIANYIIKTKKDNNNKGTNIKNEKEDDYE